MVELKQDGTIGKNIEVESNINVNGSYVAFVEEGEEVRPSDLDRLLADNQPLNGLINHELLKKLSEQNLDPAMVYVEAKAKEKVNDVRRKCGLPEVSNENMRCVYYSNEEYDQNVASVLGLYGMSDATAVSNHELDTEIIRTYDGQPSYIVGSYDVHELVHRNFDYRTRIYRKAPREGYPDQGVVLYGLARAGLAVRDVQHDRFVGVVLNELGNYYVQSEYIRSMLVDNNPLIKDDLEIREKMINERFGDSDPVSMKITLPDGRVEQVAFRRDKIHFDSNGQIINVNMMMYMQLADDIGLLCDGEGDVPVMQLLLQAKANPRTVKQVKDIMDDNIEDGFFNRVKQAKNEDPNDLLDL